MKNTIQLIQGSIEILKEKTEVLLGISAVSAIASALFEVAAPAQDPQYVMAGDWLAFGALALASMAISLLMAVALLYVFDGQSSTIMGAYKKATKVFWPYLGLSILSALAVSVGFVFLIIPGIIISVWFAFAPMALVLEKKGIIDAFKQSREYVRGKWWQIFGRLFGGIVLMLLAVAVVSIPLYGFFSEQVANALYFLFMIPLTPIVMGFVYLLYKEVAGSDS